MSTQATVRPAIHYEALDPTLKEIRVLEVAPASGDDIIECTMRRVSLLDESTPAYETISYCWGPPRAPSMIKLNRHLTTVSASSEAAIRRTQLSDRSRTLWIDAICIDQSSVTERSAQVAIMSTVYRLARRNLVCLGEDEGMAERGIRAIQYIVHDMRTATADLTLLSQTIGDERPDMTLSSNQGFSEYVDFEALESLFNLRWFRRLWVLQEIVLAQSNTCYWGAVKFDLLDTVRAARWLSYKFQFISRSLYECAGWRSALEMFVLLDLDNGLKSEHRYMFAMLDMTQRFEKTEPRDSTYAILGLIDQDRALGDREAALLRVDYTKSLSDVLRDATRYALCEISNLDVLRRINHRVDVLVDSQSFPTWTLRADLLRQTEDFHVLPVFFWACEDLEVPSLLDDVSFGEELLLLEGLVVDEVLETTIICREDAWSTNEGYHEWLVSVKDMALHHCNITMHQNIDLAIASTLVAGQAINGEKVQTDDLQVLVECIKSLTMREDDVIFNHVSIRPRLDREMRETLHAASNLFRCMDRRFFVTAAGLMGLGPRCMEPGDIVVILRGGSTPFMLRKKTDYYWLIGDAYVHDVMYGEAVQMAKSRGESEMVFPVR